MTTIESLDPANDAQFAEFHAVHLAANAEEWDRPRSAHEQRVELFDDSEYQEVRGVVARDDAGLAVAQGTIELTLKDNLGVAFIDIRVVPSRRRQGHGTAVLTHLASLARARGRTSLMGEARWDAGQTGSGHAAFAEARGFHLDITEGHRVLDLPATMPAAPASDGYTLHNWRGRCPDEWIDQYADLVSLLIQEAPSGDFPLENEFFDAARIRADEQMLVDQGRQMQVVVALAPDEILAGHTQLVFPESNPGDVYQWATLVLPKHRGHGLGLSLKVRAMEASADLLEGRQHVHTSNATSNGPMIAVNEAMGFRLVAYTGEFVRRL